MTPLSKIRHTLAGGIGRLVLSTLNCISHVHDILVGGLTSLSERQPGSGALCTAVAETNKRTCSDMLG